MQSRHALLPHQHALGPTELLLWIHALCPLLAPLPTSLLREIAAYFPLPALLPAAYQHQLLIYHTHSHICTVAERPRRIGPRACFCMLNLTQAIVFPGSVTSTLVLKLDLVSLEIEEMPNLLTPRKAPGSVYYAGEMYVFGGKLNTLALADAEKLTLKGRNWTVLPDLIKALANPLPCLHQANIYLLSAQDQGKIQLFSISQQCFRLLEVASSVWNTQVAFSTAESALYRIGEKGDVGVWRMLGERKVFEREGGQGGAVEAGSTSSPVQRDGKVYFLGKKQAIFYEVDLKELEIKARAVL